MTKKQAYDLANELLSLLGGAGELGADVGEEGVGEGGYGLNCRRRCLLTAPARG